MLKFLTLVVLVCSSVVVANANAAKADIADLNAFVGGLKTYQATFEQTQPDETLYEMNRASGYFVMQRPGKLRWVYERPEKQQIIADGRNVWIFDEELDQASVHSMKSVEADFPMSWLVYDEPLSQRFTIIPGRVENGVSWFNLVPKASTFFQSLEVAIAKGEMVQIWMYQNSDNVTKVAFNKIEKNQPVSQQAFDFSPPKGVDLIGDPIP